MPIENKDLKFAHEDGAYIPDANNFYVEIDPAQKAAEAYKEYRQKILEQQRMLEPNVAQNVYKVGIAGDGVVGGGMGKAATYAKTFEARTPLSRRKDLGTLGNASSVDTDGYYVYVRNDRNGIPQEIALIEVKNDATTWSYIGKDTDGVERSIGRLPAIGVFAFLW